MPNRHCVTCAASAMLHSRSNCLECRAFRGFAGVPSPPSPLDTQRIIKEGSTGARPRVWPWSFPLDSRWIIRQLTDSRDHAFQVIWNHDLANRSQPNCRVSRILRISIGGRGVRFPRQDELEPRSQKPCGNGCPKTPDSTAQKSTGFCLPKTGVIEKGANTKTNGEERYPLLAVQAGFSSYCAGQFTVSVTVPTVAVTELDAPLDVPVPVTVIV